MSKDRARRRAEREAVAVAVRARRERVVRRRQRRRATLRALTPKLSRRRTGRLLVRRSPAQRAAIILTGAVLVTLVWLFADSLQTKIALTLLIAATSPVLVVLTFDRRI